MHIQSKVNHICRISMLLLHVSALYERHLQGAQRILMKLCVCYVISAELSLFEIYMSYQIVFNSKQYVIFHHRKISTLILFIFTDWMVFRLGHGGSPTAQRV
jgi:hypothetical protein